MRRAAACVGARLSRNNCRKRARGAQNSPAPAWLASAAAAVATGCDISALCVARWLASTARGVARVCRSDGRNGLQRLCVAFGALAGIHGACANPRTRTDACPAHGSHKRVLTGLGAWARECERDRRCNGVVVGVVAREHGMQEKSDSEVKAVSRNVVINCGYTPHSHTHTPMQAFLTYIS